MSDNNGSADGKGELINTTPCILIPRAMRVRAISKATTPPNDQPAGKNAQRHVAHHVDFDEIGELTSEHQGGLAGVLLGLGVGLRRKVDRSGTEFCPAVAFGSLQSMPAVLHSNR